MNNRSNINKDVYFIKKYICICGVIGLLLLTFVLGYILQEKNNNYYTKEIELNNSNTVLYMNVVNYVCSDNVYVDNMNGFLFSQTMFYASTWDKDSEGGYGKCILRVKK